jgi:hypothetical protein
MSVGVTIVTLFSADDYSVCAERCAESFRVEGYVGNNFAAETETQVRVETN